MRLARSAPALAFLCFSSIAFAQNPTAATLAITVGGSPVSTVPQGTVITLTATVTLTGGAPTPPPGQVAFCEVKATPLRCTDIRLLGTAQLTRAGTATMKFLPGPGIHSYQVQFLGTHLQASSVSSAAQLTVTPSPSPTTTIITSSGSPGIYQLTATVTNTQPFPLTGTVSFHDLGDLNYTVATAPLVPVSGPALSFVSGPTIALSPTYSPAIAVADFNNDGKPDIVSSSSPVNPGFTAFLSLTTLLGNGNATFRSSPPSTIVGTSQALTVADFNGDGNQDVAAAMLFANTVQVMLGNGDGTFISKEVISLPSPQAIVSADFNDDGIPDLAVTNAALDGTINTVTILLGNGDGTFTIKSTLPTGFNPSAVAAGDFNGDGIADLAIANQGDNTVTILLSNGDGTFTPALNPATGSQPCSIAVADINGDGILDLAVLNQQNLTGPAAPGSVTILLGIGNGAFIPVGATPVTGLVPISIAAGDFNGDGKVDLTTANSATPRPPAQPTVSILPGNGDGTFAATVNTSPLIPGANPSAVAVSDFDGQGASDVAVGALNGFIATILPQLGSEAVASFTPISLVGNGGRAVDAVYSGDSNNLPSTSSTIVLIAKPVATALAVTANPPSVTYGQQILISVAISPDPAEGYIIPGGNLAINYQGLGSSVLLSSPVTIFNILPQTLGTYAVTATYTGDSNFLPSSGAVTITVNPALTTATLTSSLNPANAGQAVKFTATIAGTQSSGLPPTGSVVFSDGATLLGTVPLASSSGGASNAVFSSSTLTVGTHTITAAYITTGGYGTSSATLAQTINPVPVDFTITLASPTVALQTYQNSTTAVTLVSYGGFADTLALTCGKLPPNVTCTLTPNSTKLAANATVTASLYLSTVVIPTRQGRNRPIPAPFAPPASPIALALLFPSAGLFAALSARRRRRFSVLNFVLLAAFSVAALTLSGCGSIITLLPTATPGTYIIPITATGASTGTTHTAVLTLQIP